MITQAPRLTALDPAQASGEAKRLLDAVQGAMGMTPNMTRTMAQSPAVLEGYLGLSSALGHGTLSGKMREQIALAVGEENRCEYCVAAHTAIGQGTGLSESSIHASRGFHADDAQGQAALTFAKRLVETHGAVTDAELSAVRAVGFTEGEVGEIIANVALNVFTNYFNRVARTEVDFPKVALLARA